jgi:hypothetical protein
MVTGPTCEYPPSPYQAHQLCACTFSLEVRQRQVHDANNRNTATTAQPVPSIAASPAQHMLHGRLCHCPISAGSGVAPTHHPHHRRGQCCPPACTAVAAGAAAGSSMNRPEIIQLSAAPLAARSIKSTRQQPQLQRQRNPQTKQHHNCPGKQHCSGIPSPSS